MAHETEPRERLVRPDRQVPSSLVLWPPQKQSLISSFPCPLHPPATNPEWPVSVSGLFLPSTNKEGQFQTIPGKLQEATQCYPKTDVHSSPSPIPHGTQTNVQPP